MKRRMLLYDQKTETGLTPNTICLFHNNSILNNRFSHNEFHKTCFRWCEMIKKSKKNAKSVLRTGNCTLPLSLSITTCITNMLQSSPSQAVGVLWSMDCTHQRCKPLCCLPGIPSHQTTFRAEFDARIGTREAAIREAPRAFKRDFVK